MNFLKAILPLTILLSACSTNYYFKSIHKQAKIELITTKGILQKQRINWISLFPRKFFKKKRIVSVINIEDKKILAFSHSGIMIINSTLSNQSISYITKTATGLKSNNIKKIFYSQSGLWILYANNNTISCLKKDGHFFHYNKKNSGLKEDKVRHIEVDTSGNIWFIYQDNNTGVTRLTFGKKAIENKWLTWSTKNTPGIPSDDIFILKCEKTNTGLPGDNVWIATSRGIAFFNQEKNNWTNLGKKESVGSFLLEFAGIEDWFAKKPLRIADLEITPNGIYLCTNKAIYRFSGGKFKKIFLSDTEGLSNLIIYDITVFNKRIYAEIYRRNRSKIYFSHIYLYQPKLGKWLPIDLKAKFSDITKVQLCPTANGCYILAFSYSKSKVYYYNLNNLTLTQEKIRQVQN